jgi:hypothetical protein
MPTRPGEGDRVTAVAVDAERSARPGVPRERRAAIDPGAHGAAPEPQRRGMPAQGYRAARRSAAVYGTAQPLHGLSGALRSAAYRVPEHRTSRWMLLLAGDRLEVLERRLARGLWLVPAAAGLVVGYAAVCRALARR